MRPHRHQLKAFTRIEASDSTSSRVYHGPFPGLAGGATLWTVSSPGADMAPISALSALGYPDPVEQLRYVDDFGLTDEHIPALLELARRWATKEYLECDDESDELWAPLHAWRALADLRAESVVPALLDVLDTLDAARDEWYLEETPRICARIGAAAIDPVGSFLAGPHHGEYARIAAAHAVQAIALSDPEARERAKTALVRVLEPCSDAHPSLNGFLISYLLDLEAVEHADVIKRAYDKDVVDWMVCGDWERVAFRLGIGPPPPPRPSLLDEVNAMLLSHRPDPDPASLPPQTTRRPSRPSQRPADKAARKRQKQARKKNRRR